MTNQFAALSAVLALVRAAVPECDVLGLENEGAPPDRVPQDGRVVLRRGDPGDPQIDLSPVTYNYDHQIPLQIAAIGGLGYTAAERLAGILERIGAAILADRTAGDVLDWLDATAPSLDDIYTSGAPSACEVEAILVASYSTTSPL